MSQEETADLLNSDRRRHLTGIGIPNVHERLRLIYGEEYGVTIHSVIGTGTSVSLRPVSYTHLARSQTSGGADETDEAVAGAAGSISSGLSSPSEGLAFT